MLQNVTRALDSGYKRVVVEAVPGAGKSHTLRALAKGHKTLVLAYNSFLAAETLRCLDEERDVTTVCVTFHALCGRYIGLARDDFQLEQLVGEVERGTRTTTGVPSFDRVLVDEAQDVRPLYIRLLRVLDLLRDDATLVVVGDRLQLVYDFDEDFPASLDVLTNPPRAILPGSWTRIVTNETHRLTRPMCATINGMFGSRIFTERDGPRVEVRCPRSAFGLYGVLADLTEPFLLLVDRRRNNAPLRELLNQFSRHGVAVHVHGVDAGEASDDDHVRCATFWSAKGVQHSTVVVLLPGSAARNPTYVALTRSSHRLVVVLDPKDPHAAFCEYAASHPSHFDVVGPDARRVLQMGRERDAAESMRQRPRAPRPVVALDTAVPRTSAVKSACAITEEEKEVEEAPPDRDDEDASHALVLCQMARAWVETLATHRCRAVEGLLQPTRMDASVRDAAIVNGFVGRAVSPYQTDVLSPDLLQMASEAYAVLQTSDETRLPDVWEPLFRVAAAALTWEAFEYIMRRHAVPRCDAERFAWVRRTIPSDVVFDTRLVTTNVDGDRAFHVRAHASSARCAYHVEWDLSSTEIGMAAVRALLHPNRTCRLVVLGTMRVVTVSVADPSVLWEAILSDRA